MQWIEKFDLFLFDFDGLLVNSEELHFKAYKEMCHRRGFALSWDINQFFKAAHLSAVGIKEGLKVLFPKMFEAGTPWEVLYAEKKSIYEDLLRKGNLSLLPGVEVLLKQLAQRGKKRCVVTNSALVQVERIQSQISVLQTIPRWFTREDYERPKPAPDGYLKALGELKEPGDRVIGFEDSLRGYESLKSAGVETGVLICPLDHPQLELKVDDGRLHVTSFEELSL
jgi:HAD superfamily hydrolase (TIGR01509 family)